MTVTTDTEALVRRAYHLAEGDVLDVQGFIDLFAEDGVMNLGHAGVEPRGVGQESYRGGATRRGCTPHRQVFPRCPS